MLDFEDHGYPFQNLTKAAILSWGGVGGMDIHAPFSKDSQSLRPVFESLQRRAVVIR